MKMHAYLVRAVDGDKLYAHAVEVNGVFVGRPATSDAPVTVEGTAAYLKGRIEASCPFKGMSPAFQFQMFAVKQGLNEEAFLNFALVQTGQICWLEDAGEFEVE